MNEVGTNVSGEQPQPTVTVDEQVEKYLEIRNLIKEMDDAHSEKLKPLREIQEKIGGWLQAFMEQSGSEAVKTKHGTAYATTKYSATLADPDAFMKFVIANGKFDLIDRRANLTAVKDYVEENSTLPPGCNLTAVKRVNVRTS